MEGVVREREQLIDRAPVIVHLVARPTILARITVLEGEDSSPARVQPVPGSIAAVARD